MMLNAATGTTARPRKTPIFVIGDWLSVNGSSVLLTNEQ
jgi:hypothetical protein